MMMETMDPILEITSGTAERAIYATIMTMGNIVGLIGNVLVIMATLRPSRITQLRLDLGTVIFLRHLAICDVLSTVLYPIPISIVYITGKWVFGWHLCQAIGLLISIPVVANINFILAMSLHRYIRCKYPLKIQQLTSIRAQVMIGIIWCLSCTFIVYTLLAKLKIVFNPSLANCTFTFKKAVGNAVLILCTTALPFVIIVTTNILLWIHVNEFTNRLAARNHETPRSSTVVRETSSRSSNGSRSCSIPMTPRHSNTVVVSRTLTVPSTSYVLQQDELTSQQQTRNRRLKSANRHGLIITTLITALFAITWAPTVLRFTYSAFYGEGNANLPDAMEKIRYFYFFGSWGNPVIYATINKGFREYFKRFLHVNIMTPMRRLLNKVTKGTFTIENRLPAVTRASVTVGPSYIEGNGIRH